METYLVEVSPQGDILVEIVAPDEYIVEVSEPDEFVVEISNLSGPQGVEGPQGPVGPAGLQGPTGPQGPQGVAGASGGSYMHTQNVSSTTWVITHNLGFFPQVTVVESGGATVEGSLVYNSSNQITITFNVSISGYAYVS